MALRGLSAALLLAALAVGGCATTRPEGGGLPWTSGRMNLRVEATAAQPAQSNTVNFDLQGSDDAGELRLNAPGLGSRLATARWAPGLAVLITGDGERRYASLDELSREALGETLPLAALPDWLAGRPWSGAPQAAATGGFEQLGWQVDVSRRADGIVEARRAAAPVIVVRVRLEQP